jgi:phosphoribosylformylglycinamidine synthase
MLLIVKKGREKEVERIFEKWDLHAVKIGEVTADDRLRIRDHGALVADVPNRALTDEAPVYQRPFKRPEGFEERWQIPRSALQPLPRPADTLRALLASLTVASKQWIYRQYDSMVRTNTIALAGLSAGVVRVKGTSRALAMSVDGNGRFCFLDPRQGAKLAVAEAARNVACAGGLPIGATNCLNFGNPERPEIMWQFAEAVAGIGEACRALDVPITGGNVSLYNETDGSAILPTPILGIVGLIEDASTVMTRVFPAAGLDLILLGDASGELGGSEYLKTIHGLLRGRPPVIDLARERALINLIIELIGRRLVRSAHDCAEGGLAVTLAESCFDTGGIGAEISIPGCASDGGVDRVAATLFGESASRILVSVVPERVAEVLGAAKAAGVPAHRIGRTGGAAIRIEVDGEAALECAVSEVEALWRSSLESRLAGRAA